MEKAKVAIIGATGFTGEKIVSLLSRHAYAEITYLTSRAPKPFVYGEKFSRYKNIVGVKCQQFNLAQALKKADVFFLSLPHTVSMQIAPSLLAKGKKVIDLSADYRLKNTAVYKQFYGIPHKDKKNLKKAVYGLCEFNRKKIKNTDFIANPGCYPTAVLLGLLPLYLENAIAGAVSVDAKSAISGAGRKALLDFHYNEINGNIWAYKPFVHQHLPEITQQVKAISKNTARINFFPHVVSVEAGIYASIYVTLKKKTSLNRLNTIYKKYYHKEFFVRVKEKLPRLKDVAGTNFCDIGFSLSSDGKQAIIACAIDNLIKGAAGSAVQNMNIMLGFPEREGLV